MNEPLKGKVHQVLYMDTREKACYKEDLKSAVEWLIEHFSFLDEYVEIIKEAFPDLFEEAEK